MCYDSARTCIVVQSDAMRRCTEDATLGEPALRARGTNAGRFVNMFVTVIVSCVLSAARPSPRPLHGGSGS